MVWRSVLRCHPVATPPQIGALLRMAYEDLREEQLARLIAAGFDDLRAVHRGALTYPPIDGLRPSELAARMDRSKQHANDPEAYLNAATQFKNNLVSKVTAQAGPDVGEALGKAIEQTTTYNYRRLASEQQDTIRRNLAKDTEWVIESNKESLISLIKSGGLDTPDGMKKAAGFITNIDAALQERSNNPILSAPKSESDKVHTELGRDMDAAKFEAKINKTLQSPSEFGVHLVGLAFRC